MRGRSLIEQARRLERLEARAAYSAAVASFDGRAEDCEAWSKRADRLSAQAKAARKGAFS